MLRKWLFGVMVWGCFGSTTANAEDQFWQRHAVDNNSRRGGGADGVRLADVNGTGCRTS